MISITALTAIIFAAQMRLPTWLAMSLGIALTALFGAFCLHRLAHEVGLARLLRRRKSS
jgi:uncharacterized membrane protein YfcA